MIPDPWQLVHFRIDPHVELWSTSHFSQLGISLHFHLPVLLHLQYTSCSIRCLRFNFPFLHCRRNIDCYPLRIGDPCTRLALESISRVSTTLERLEHPGPEKGSPT